ISLCIRYFSFLRTFRAAKVNQHLGPCDFARYMPILLRSFAEVRFTCESTPHPCSCQSPGDLAFPALFGQRIGTKLKTHHFGARALAAFHVERRTGPIRGPEFFAFPSQARIVDPAIHVLREKAHGVRDTKNYELSVYQREERIVGIAGGDRN